MDGTPPAGPTLPELLAHYRGLGHGDDALVDDFLELHGSEGADPYRRERLEAHFTASAWLVDRAGRRALLTHHRKLGLWLQPGGHADGDRDLARVALREASEESGLAALAVVPEVYDIDRHWIPAHREVPAHWHYDVRFVVRAGDSEAFVVGDESHALAWREVAGIAADPAMDASLRRMARRWLCTV
jgi:8-oxo-dGTP pyrophosphatase MutT (NUDIX family)